MARKLRFFLVLFITMAVSSVTAWAGDVIEAGSTLEGRLFRTDADFSVSFTVEVKQQTGDGAFVGDIKIADRNQTVLSDQPIRVGAGPTISFRLNFGERVFAPLSGQAQYRAEWNNQFRGQPASYAAEFMIK